MKTAALSGVVYTNEIFEGLTREQVAGILPCIADGVKTYSVSECVIDKGQLIRGPGIVLDGELVRRGENAGDTAATESIGKNQMFGAAAAFSGGGARERMIAEKPARVLYLSGAFFLSPCENGCANRDAHRIIARNMLRMLSLRARELDRKVEFLTAGELKRKIAMYLLELHEKAGEARTLEMPLNRDRLAEFFSVARPSLSRELIALKRLGVIDFYRSRVTVLDIAALRHIARGE